MPTGRRGVHGLVADDIDRANEYVEKLREAARDILSGAGYATGFEK